MVAPPDYTALGAGGSEDRLHLRLLVRLLLRCAGLMKPVRWHVLALFLGFALIALYILPFVVILFDLFWTRALAGQPVPLDTAVRMGLDPAVAVHVETLGAETRREIARQAIWIGFFLAGTAIPASLGLYYYQMWLLQRINQFLRVDLLERLQTLSLRFHAETKVGDAIYRLYQDSAMVTQLVDVLLITPIMASFRFLFMVAIVAAFDPILSVLMLALWPPCLMLGWWYSRRLRVNFRSAREANSALTSRIQETLSGIRVIKAYGAEQREQARFEKASLKAFGEAFSARRLLATFNIAVFWLVGSSLLIASALATRLTQLGVDLYAAAALAAAGLSVWNLGLYNASKFFVGSGTDQVRLLLRTWGRTQDIAIGLDRVFELLDLEPEVQDAEDAVPLAPIRVGVRFRDVRFRYQPGRPALEGVDLEAKVGAITAIVGPTGSGKSTLMAMLLRLFDPDAGSIEIDGTDLRGIQLASLRARVGIALQENVLFGTTVRENIRYAVPQATPEEVAAAAYVACADEFIRAQPQGYDTLLGERGTKLSSGQRQRISISRAILKQPDVLVLDEPTASLDAETEVEMLRRLATWGKERAIFLITHRLSTVRHADHIIFLRDGRAVEQGTHEELIAQGGAYRALVHAEDSAAERAAAGVALEQGLGGAGS